MLKSVEAMVEVNGDVHLNEPLQIGRACRAIVTLLDDSEQTVTAVLSENSLKQDWDKPEEEEAWSHLQ